MDMNGAVYSLWIQAKKTLSDEEYQDIVEKYRAVLCK